MGGGRVLLTLFMGILLGGLTFWTSEALAPYTPGAVARSPGAEGVGFPRVLVGTPVLPREVFFAGERVPLQYADVYESLMRELCVVANWHSSVLMIMKLSGRYFPTIEPILAAQGVPDDFKYLAVAESALNPRAISPSRAVGLWQFIEGTGKDYGLRIDGQVDERYHTVRATEAACAFLKKSYAEFGSWAMAAASYNMGQNGIRRTIKAQRERNFYNLHTNPETSRYLFRIIALKLVLEQPTLYGFNLEKEARFRPELGTTEIVESSISNLADFAQERGSNYKMLKWLNPWLMDTLLTVKEGERFELKLLSDDDRTDVYGHP